MKTILFFFALSVACGQIVEDRRYFIEEEKANSNKSFILMQDERGKIHLIDLKVNYPGNLANISDVTIYLYTRKYPTTPCKIEVVNFEGNINCDLFIPSKTNVFTTHGWSGSYLSKTNILTKDGILANEDANVFIVDWKRPANEFYTVARQSVGIVGKIVGDFINKLMEKNNILSKQITLVGQSLGGHVIGSIGSNMKVKPSILIALDPAQPLFYIDEPEDRLDTTDGEFVQIIHTNGGFLGFKSSIGHVDFYPNGGGMNQPGCGSDLLGTCAHYRAYYLFGEALLTSGFKAHKCTNYNEYEAGNCLQNESTYMSAYPINKTIRGDFYLNTAAATPYALG